MPRVHTMEKKYMKYKVSKVNRDVITGNPVRVTNPINKKVLNKHEMDDYFGYVD